MSIIKQNYRFVKSLLKDKRSSRDRQGSVSGKSKNFQSVKKKRGETYSEKLPPDSFCVISFFPPAD